MTNRTILFIKVLAVCLTVISYDLQAQSISKDVVNTAGATLANDQSILVWSLGEVAITEYELGNLTLAEGFLGNSTILITGLEEFNKGPFQLSYYPNPTDRLLNLSRNNIDERLDIRLYDLNGRLDESWEMVPGDSNITLDMNLLASGTYILRIFDEQQNHLKTGKILVIH